MNRGVAELSESALARRRMVGPQGAPVLSADWEDVLFLHFEVPAQAVQRLIPRPLETEPFQGKTLVSIVSLSMRRFQLYRGRWLNRLLRPIEVQRFLNVRTYARSERESGAYFLQGWLSRPCALLPAPGLFGLPCAFCEMDFSGDREGAAWRRTARSRSGLFEFEASAPAGELPADCLPGSLERFTFERYTGYFERGHDLRTFRIWHAPWKQVQVKVCLQESSLITTKFPWFKEAILAGANWSAGFKDVWLGLPSRPGKNGGESCSRRRGPSSFFELP
jgi:uncharacterized protein YqjF (DUF2071 family)